MQQQPPSPFRGHFIRGLVLPPRSQRHIRQDNSFNVVTRVDLFQEEFDPTTMFVMLSLMSPQLVPVNQTILGGQVCACPGSDELDAMFRGVKIREAGAFVFCFTLFKITSQGAEICGKRTSRVFTVFRS